uniref:Uncharacterized protein n=1 Tax=Phlebotomus papatasi TaxID=29031 RepID=A0A1B0CYS5_PHLPP
MEIRRHRGVILILAILLFCLLMVKCVHCGFLEEHCSVTEEKILQCSNASLSDVSGRFFGQDQSYTEIILRHIENGDKRVQLELKGENATEVLVWTDSGMSDGQFRGLMGERRRFTRLRKLDVSGNDISQLPERSFAKLIHLKILNLSGNRIGNVSGNIFMDLQSLLELNLSGNQLERISTVTWSPFGYLKQLLVLNLADNMIKDLPRHTFRGLETLKKLHLQRNQLSIVPFQLFADIGMIEMLDLAHNGIMSIHDNHFIENGRLQVLNMHHNHLVSIFKNTFNGLNQLEYLNIAENRINFIDRNAFSSLDRLKYLNVSGNYLLILSSSIFSSLNGLLQLDLSGNPFESLPNGILMHQYALQEFYLSRTGLRRLGNLVARQNATVNRDVLRHMKKFHLQDNGNLTCVDGSVLTNAPAIEILRITGSPLLTMVPKEIGDLSNLKVLDLHGNALTFLPENLGKLPQLRYVNFIANDFACDCRMHWMVSWIRKLLLVQENTTNMDFLLDTPIDGPVINIHDLKCRNGYPGDMLRVLQQLHCFQPSLIHVSPATMHLLQSDVTLECSFTGNPTPNIIWVTPHNQILRHVPDPDMKIINPDQHQEKYQQHIELQFLNTTMERRNHTRRREDSTQRNSSVDLLENGYLRVHNISRSDSGIYTCYAWNIMGNTSSDVR